MEGQLGDSREEIQSLREQVARLKAELEGAHERHTVLEDTLNLTEAALDDTRSLLLKQGVDVRPLLARSFGHRRVHC